MPAIRPGYVVEIPARNFGLGSSDTRAKRMAYTTSPIFDGTYSSDETVRAAFFQPRELSGGQINDGGYAFGLVDRYYQGAPDLSTVEVGGGGKPGSPFAPNLGVPGEGNGHNPAAIPDTGVELTNNLRSRSQGAFIGNGLVSPNSTVGAIVDPAQKGLGIGSGNSFRVRIS
jgi:hypothetical protein